MPKAYEGGLRNQRLEFVRESTTGVTPSNPSWNLFSDTARLFEPEPSSEGEAQRGLSDAFPNNHFASTESHQLTVTYDYQQAVASGGSAQGAGYDALQRDSDQRIPNTHTVVRRMSQSDIDAANTWNGSTSYDTRKYVVGKGGYPATWTMTIDPSESQPVNIELEYEFEKIRVYQIDQPGSASQLAAKSTDSNDTSQSLTIQGTDGTGSNAEESGTLSGTTLVEFTTSFDNIDAIELDSETAGDVEVYLDTDGTSGSITQGDQLAVIRGQNSYDHGEGDLGVPALGTGSHASAIGSSYELPPTVIIERPDGTTLADEVGVSSIVVESEIDDASRTETGRPALSAGDITPQVEATVFGETEYYQSVDEMLRLATNNLRHEFQEISETIQVDNATPLEVSASDEASQSKKETEITYQGEGITLS